MILVGLFTIFIFLITCETYFSDNFSFVYDLLFCSNINWIPNFYISEYNETHFTFSISKKNVQNHVTK